jgi:hypothetical protein
VLCSASASTGKSGTTSSPASMMLSSPRTRYLSRPEIVYVVMPVTCFVGAQDLWLAVEGVENHYRRYLASPVQANRDRVFRTFQKLLEALFLPNMTGNEVLQLFESIYVRRTVTDIETAATQMGLTVIHPEPQPR